MAARVDFPATKIVDTSKNAVRELVNKSAASAASLEYVKFQAVIQSAAIAQPPLAEAALAADLIKSFFLHFLAVPAANKYAKSNENVYFQK